MIFTSARLTAIVHPENLASIRSSLEKLGFLTERRDTIIGMKSIVFSLRAKDGETDSCFHTTVCHSIGPEGTYTKACAASIPARSSRPTNTGNRLWLMAEEPEKTFLQGLIQVAAAFQPFSAWQLRAGTISLLRSLGWRPAGWICAGFCRHRCRAALQRQSRLWLEAIETVSQSPPPPLSRPKERPSMLFNSCGKRDHYP